MKKSQKEIDLFIQAATHVRDQYSCVLQNAGHKPQADIYLKEFDATKEAYYDSLPSYDGFVKKNRAQIMATLKELRRMYEKRSGFAGVGLGMIEDGRGIRHNFKDENFTLFVHFSKKPSAKLVNSCVELNDFQVTISGPWPSRG